MARKTFFSIWKTFAYLFMLVQKQNSFRHTTAYAAERNFLTGVLIYFILYNTCLNQERICTMQCICHEDYLISHVLELGRNNLYADIRR